MPQYKALALSAFSINPSAFGETSFRIFTNRINATQSFQPLIIHPCGLFQETTVSIWKVPRGLRALCPVSPCQNRVLHLLTPNSIHCSVLIGSVNAILSEEVKEEYGRTRGV